LKYMQSFPNIFFFFFFFFCCRLFISISTVHLENSQDFSLSFTCGTGKMYSQKPFFYRCFPDQSDN
jgi:hypothetical protein